MGPRRGRAARRRAHRPGPGAAGRRPPSADLDRDPAPATRRRGPLAAALDPQLGAVRAMTIYYDQIRAVIDPEQSDPLPGGGRLQDVSVILVDKHGGGRPVAIALLACQ